MVFKGPGGLATKDIGIHRAIDHTPPETPFGKAGADIADLVKFRVNPAVFNTLGISIQHRCRVIAGQLFKGGFGGQHAGFHRRM